jgi:hypothetical protein
MTPAAARARWHAVFLLSVLAAFLGLYVAISFWLVLLPAARVLVGRAVHGRNS